MIGGLRDYIDYGPLCSIRQTTGLLIQRPSAGVTNSPVAPGLFSNLAPWLRAGRDAAFWAVLGDRHPQILTQRHIFRRLPMEVYPTIRSPRA